MSDVSSDFPAAGRVSDVDGVFQVERSREFGEIVRIGVHIVAVERLAGSSVAAAIVSDAPIAFFSEEEHLIFKRVGVERPTMTEDDRLTGSPVFVKEGGAVPQG